MTREPCDYACSLQGTFRWSRSLATFPDFGFHLPQKRKLCRDEEEDEHTDSGESDERDGDGSTDASSEEEEELCFTVIANGDLEALRGLHEDGRVDLHAGDSEEGDTPFGVACRFGHLAIAQWLREQGVAMDARNNVGDTALHEACLNGHLDVIEWLMSNLPTSMYDAANVDGMTPLCYASLHGRTLAIERLVAAGCSLSSVDSQGHTAMHLACSNGHIDAAKKLLSLGVPAGCLDALGRSPLHIAAGASQFETTRWLVEDCAHLVDATDANGTTPLLFACASGDSAIAEWLLANGAKATTANSDGNTPLHYACQAGTERLVRALLQIEGVVPSCKNVDGDTPMLLACFNGRVEICAILADFGQPLNGTNEAGCSGLLQAQCPSFDQIGER